ncbi:hypothetical protein M422DRAFT_71619 [Sphaerobolus stellatus SS14]|uniref:Aminoglycoside phosphotransferase domain-containing protein n=1 Tax=Sphaerobolus stellatus (strain SS14) TaxID=990650 RepID=A0A0C9UQ98_SPHS4|nr:hypothetical protein M422DRAFT_71619 [Sphaerobolus stellatus SS14]
MHADFDAQDMLFTINDGHPRLTAVIDWEFSHTVPLYFLYKYPIFIQDVDWSKELYTRNVVLRSSFRRSLRNQFTNSLQDFEQAKVTLPNGKCSRLNRFSQIFMQGTDWDWSFMEGVVREYVQSEKESTGNTYKGRADWTPDHDTDTES